MIRERSDADRLADLGRLVEAMPEKLHLHKVPAGHWHIYHFDWELDLQNTRDYRGQTAAECICYALLGLGVPIPVSSRVEGQSFGPGGLSRIDQILDAAGAERFELLHGPVLLHRGTLAECLVAAGAEVVSVGPAPSSNFSPGDSACRTIDR